MTQPAVLVTLIVSLITMKEIPQRDQAMFVSADGGTFIASTVDPQSVRLRMAKRAVEEHKLVALRFDPTTRLISAAYWPMPDTVTSIAEDKKSPDRLVVVLRMRPTLVYLVKGTPQFDELLKVLERSLREESPLRIAVEPVGSTILAAVRE